MDLFTISAVLTLETARFANGIRNATRQGNDFARNLQNRVSAGTVALGNLMADATKATGRALLQLTKDALNLTGELEQNLGGSEAVFGEWAENIQAEGQQAFKQMGLSMSDYLATANRMGSLFKGSGYTTAEAFDMTSKAMQRAADVASIMGISTESAMESVAGMAKGNFTMMDNLGVAINDTTLAIYAQEKGISQSVRSMTTAQKVSLAYQLFMEKTATYAGNYAKENDTLAGSLATAKAAFDNFMSGGGTVDDFVDSTLHASKVVGQNLMEIVPRLFNGFAEAGRKAWPKVKESMDKFWDNEAPQIATNGANAVIGTINAVFGTQIPKVEKIELPKSSAISAQVSEWWSGEKSVIESLCEWSLPIFKDPIEDGAAKLNAWWEMTKENFNKSFVWTLQMFRVPDADLAAKEIYNWFGDIKKKFAEKFKPTEVSSTTPTVINYSNPDSWNSIENMSGYGAAGVPMETILNPQLAPGAETKLQAAVDNMDLHAMVDLMVNVRSVRTVMTKAISSVSQYVKDWSDVLGDMNRGYATGLNYVPYNDFPARLHEGEAVLTKSQASEWRSGASAQSVSIDYDRLAAAVASAMGGMSVQMDGHAVGVMVAPTVSAEMGRQSKSRRYTG